MPFVDQEPRPFTEEGVDTLKPDQIGVYGIFRKGLWIYVGRGDIRARLLRHLAGDTPCILLENPTHFVAQLTDEPETQEKQLIRELNPLCNRRVG